VVLVDTSIWIAHSAPGGALDIEKVAGVDEACLPVIQEVLQGARDEWAHRKVRSALLLFSIVEDPLTRPVFEEAASLYRMARRAGITIRSSNDCLIAAIALRNDLEILHRDRDYAALAKIAGLRQREV